MFGELAEYPPLKVGDDVFRVMIKNLFDMPVWMRTIPIIGMLAPLLAVFTIITEDIPLKPSIGFGDVVVYTFIIISTLPILFASIFMLKKSKSSRYGYVLGWFVICFSPLLMSSVRAEIDVFWGELPFVLLIGVVLALYLFRNKKVNNYWSK